jgi:hypothetical protein
MKDLDFLPQRYREETHLRRAQLWRTAVLALFGVVVGGTALGQYGFQYSLRRELAAIEGAHAEALAKTEQFAQLSHDLEEVRFTADLYAYLRHPWPRTQILAAVAEHLPSELVLSELRIARETASGRSEPSHLPPPPTQAEGGKAPELPAAVQDVQRLRQECDAGRTIVEVSGLACDIASLHTFVAKLGETPLFSRCELAALESAGDGKSPVQTRFRVRLTVRPGYGQPGGPSPQASAVAVAVTVAPAAEGVAP